MKRALTIPEALFLLARHNETGKPKGNNNAFIQPAGALAELVLMERLALRPGRKAIVEVLDASPIGNVYLDAILAKVQASKRPRSMQHWVSRLSNMRGRIAMIGDGLVAKGIVGKVPGKVLWVFPVTRWPVLKLGTKSKLEQSMKRILFQNGAMPDEWTGTLIAMANSGHLLKRNFDRAELRTHKHHIKAVTKGEWPAADAARKAIVAAQAAVTAVIASVAITGAS